MNNKSYATMDLEDNTATGKPSKRISRWLLFKLMFKVGMYVVLILVGWGAIVWGSFLLAFPVGLIVSGISLFGIAWALNKGIEDTITKSADIYVNTVFPVAEPMGPLPLEDFKDDSMDILDMPEFDTVGDPMYTGDPTIGPLMTPETAKNGGNGMMFEFEEADAVVLDPVDKEIDDILHGGK